MKKRTNISSLKKGLLLGFGVLTALLVVFSGPIQSGIEASLKDKVCINRSCEKPSTPAEKKDKKEVELNPLSYQAIVPSVAHLSASVFTTPVFFTDFSEPSEEKEADLPSVSLSKYLSVVLQKIISTNAP